MSAVEYTIMIFGKNNQNIPVADIMTSYQKLNTFPEAVQVLDYIKSKNYKMAVLSNGDSEMLREVLEILVFMINLTPVFLQVR